jgi:hypothetical protein
VQNLGINEKIRKTMLKEKAILLIEKMHIPVKVASDSGNKLPLTNSYNSLPYEITKWQF